jgi:hypothetical protein
MFHERPIRWRARIDKPLAFRAEKGQTLTESLAFLSKRREGLVGAAGVEHLVDGANEML